MFTVYNEKQRSIHDYIGTDDVTHRCRVKTRKEQKKKNTSKQGLSYRNIASFMSGGGRKSGGKLCPPVPINMEFIREKFFFVLSITNLVLPIFTERTPSYSVK